MKMKSRKFTGLIKTKYMIPGRNKQLFSRQGFNKLLDAALNFSLTLITAPAGYGKTSAVSKWLETTEVPHAWLTVDENDNDLILFWRYVCAALDHVSANMGEIAETVFPSTESFQPDMYLNILIDNLFSLQSDAILVLDDLHFISSSCIYESLFRFITYLPPGMHVILISRINPPIKLSHLNMKDKLLELQAKDLRFDKEEIFHYFENKGYYLKEDEVDIIENYTEGWGAAMVAVTHLLRSAGSVQNAINDFSGSTRQIEHYFSENLIPAWTETQKDFLEKTSILDKMCIPLCEAVTGYEVTETVTELFRQNWFIESDFKKGWFKNHHLLSDYLRKRLKNNHPRLFSQLHNKAAAWLKDNCLHNEAVEHLLEGCNYEDAVLLIEQYGGICFRQGNYSIPMSWINRLPAEYAMQHPMIMVFKAFYFSGQNDYARASEYVDMLSLYFEVNDRDAFIYTRYLMVKANLLIIKGDMKGSFDAIVQAAAFKNVDKFHEYYVDFNLYDISMYRSMYVPLIRVQQRHPEHFASYSSHYRSIVHAYPGYSPLIRGEVCYETGNITKAIEELSAAVDEALNVCCPGSLVPAMVTIAKIKRVQGDIWGALQTAGDCLKILISFQKSNWVLMVKAFIARLYMEENNLKQIDLWMSESGLSIYKQLSRAREFEFIVYARALIKKQRYVDANNLLMRLLHFSENLERNHSIVEILNLLAITAMAELNEDRAINYIKRALSIGMEEGFIRSFTDEGQPMTVVLQLFLKKEKKRNKLSAYTANLLTLTKESVRNSFSPADCDTIESTLTKAEKKVLKLIIKGYANKEIAEELYITARTASAHTTNIYRKLGVKNRTQCVNKAHSYKFL